MAFYKIKLGTVESNNQPSQSQLIDAFKAQGEDVIQTSDGLCLKTVKDLESLSRDLEHQGLPQSSITSIDESTPDLSKDVLAFMGRPV